MQVLNFDQEASFDPALNIDCTILKTPLFNYYVSAGFPSPADDYIQEAIDLNRYLIRHPTATFFFRMKGEAMRNSGILPDSILIVDRSLVVRNGKIIVAEYKGSLIVRRYHKDTKTIRLLSENKNYPPLIHSEASPIIVWGVVTSIITHM